MDFNFIGIHFIDSIFFKRKLKMKLQDIIIWILFVLAIITILWYVFGNSLTIEQAILTLILTLSITTIVKLSALETRFNLLARDFRKHIKHK